MLTTSSLDDLDLKLLDALQANARSTYAELAALVGLTAPSVHERVKRLESRGFVRKYAAQLNARLLGLELAALVSCFTSPETDYDRFTADVSRFGEVCEVHSVAGDETYILKVVTASTAHLDDFLGRLKKVPGIVRTKTTIVLSTPFERGGIALRRDDGRPAPNLHSVR